MVRKLSVKQEKTPEIKNEFVESVEKSLKTPMGYIKYCYLSKPFFYTGSHVPRYSITLLFDKNLKDHKEFLENLEKIATKIGVDSLGYIDDGLISIKFQGQNMPKLFSQEKGRKKIEEIELEHDIPEGFKASVDFELKTYFNKTSKKKAFNFSPQIVTFLLDDENLELTDSKTNKKAKNGDNKSSGNRPRLEDNGIRDSKLPPRKKRDLG